MNSFPRFLSNLARNDAAWTCSSCAKTLCRNPSTPFFNPSRRMRRDLSNSSKTPQNVAPTMEQLRAPFRKKNSSTLYYTLSIILGTVAFSYGSVPMYKMVRCFYTPRRNFNNWLYAQRFAKRRDGEANPLKPQAMVGPKAAILLRASNPLLLPNASA